MEAARKLCDDCVFCKIIRGLIPCHKVYEDDLVLAFADIGPLSRGHCLVIPKYHETFFHLLPDSYAAALGPAIRRVAAGVVAALGATDYNIINNNGESCGQTVPHVHWHIVPRWADGTGLGLEWRQLKDLGDEEIPRYAEKIREKISEAAAGH